MRAAVNRRYGGPDVVEVVEVATPVPNEHDVLIRVAAATVSAADSATRRADPVSIRLAFGLLRPRMATLGTEFAGTIAATGSAVTQFAVGDQVVAASGARFGAHAEYIVLGERAAIASKPPELSFADAAAVAEGGLTALPFLRDGGQLRAGQSILISGASGSVGTAAIQLAKVIGARVTAVCSGANAELVRSLGADEVVDYTTADFTAVADTNGHRYDVIFDAVGTSSFAKSAPVLSPTGRYLTTVPSPTTLIRQLLTSRGSGKRARILFTGLRAPSDRAADLAYLMRLAATGAYRPVIDRRFALAEIANAHRYVDSGRKRGNVVVEPRNGLD
ncbi:MAG: NAD(P)-dependent alcohol dehydrogenase [Glaciihabitans sp.]|nr:NAD(P)-dependent alcohol dehydrogenase [Glaciihabitans sp.]